MTDVKTINVSEPWFSFIKKGRKKIEGRLNKGSFANLKVGEKIKFVNKDESCLVKIINIVKYDTFKDYLMLEGLKRTLPNVKTLDEGVNVYYQYYTKEQEKEFGILAIYIKLIDK
uniref:ASCH domain-containing protein n=1 Tax=viral metagenome TaxID=1070528 RepID=A0A6C0EA10_9ZZZZ